MEGGRVRRMLAGLTVSLWLPIALVAFWEALARFGDSPFFPPPTAIGLSLANLSAADFFERHVAQTLALFAFGVIVGSSSGVMLGALLGARHHIYRLLAPIAVFLRSIPTAAKVPVLLGIVGIGSNTTYLAVTIAVFLNVLVVTMIGVGRVERDFVEAGALLNLGFWRQTFLVKVQAATGEILTGLQNALQIGLLVTVFVEFLISPTGVGSFLRQSQERFQITEMWVALAVTGVMGFLANEGFLALERRLVPWFFTVRSARGL